MEGRGKKRENCSAQVVIQARSKLPGSDFWVATQLFQFLNIHSNCPETDMTENSQHWDLLQTLQSLLATSAKKNWQSLTPNCSNLLQLLCYFPAKLLPTSHNPISSMISSKQISAFSPQKLQALLLNKF